MQKQIWREIQIPRLVELNWQYQSKIAPNLQLQAGKSRHRRLSGSAAETSLTEAGIPAAGSRLVGPAVLSTSSVTSVETSGYRRRSLSDSRSNNARSSGEY